MQLHKNKKFTKSLIAFVIILWAVIVFKMFDFTSGSKQLQIESAMEKSFDDDNLDIIHNQELLITNKDPFGMRQSHKTIKPQNKAIKMVKRQLPQISYLGYMQKGQNGKKLANLNFKNTFTVKAENDTIGEFRLIKVFDDSILMSYNNEKFYIIKNQ